MRLGVVPTTSARGSLHMSTVYLAVTSMCWVHTSGDTTPRAVMGRQLAEMLSVSDAELARDAKSTIEWASAVDAHKRANP